MGSAPHREPRREPHRDATAELGTVRSGPLCGGQRWHWFEHHLEPGRQAFSIPVTDCCAVPDGVSVPEVRAALRRVAGRYEALRTVISTADASGTGPVQSVQPLGAQEVELSEVVVDDGTLDEQCVERVAGELLAVPFEIDRRWAWRAAVVVRAGDPVLLVVVAHHVLVDGWALGLVVGEVADDLAGRGREAAPAPHHPLDEVAAERTPRARAAAARATEHWLDVLRTCPPNLLEPFGDQDGGAARVTARLQSPALPGHCRTLAARYGVTESAVLLAAFAFLLAERTGEERFVLDVVVSNRSTARTRSSVAPRAVPVLVPVHVPAGLGFDELCRRTSVESARAYRHLGYDPVELRTRSLAEAARSGTDARPLLDFTHHSVDRSHLPPDAAPAVRHDTIEVDTEPQPCGAVYVDVETVRGILRVDLVAGDHLLDAGAATGLLRRWAELLGAAATGTAPRLRPGPGTPGPGWTRRGTDGWVHPGRIEEVLSDGGPVTAVAVVVEDDGAVVARAVPDGPGVTPQEVRRFVLDRLAGLPGAVAPDRVELFGEAPSDPSDRNAWAGCPRLEAAPGVDRSGPDGPLEAALAAAVRAVWPADPPPRIDMTISFSEHGGEFPTAPAVVAHLAACGYRGIGPDDLLPPASLRAVAALLTHGRP